MPRSSAPLLLSLVAVLGLAACAQQQAAAPPPPSQLAAQFGADFDRQFMSDQVKNHQEAVQLFEAEARTGQDPRLRKYATDTLPMLYRNLQQAQAISARLGG